MPATWSALQISLKCKSEPSDVYDPTVGSKETPRNSVGKRSGKCSSGCSRSLSNLRDVIHGGKRHAKDKERPPNPTGSPRSFVRSTSDLFNHIRTHKVIVSDHKCEIEISGFERKDGDAHGSSVYLGIPRPGTPNREETCSEVKNSIEEESHSFICHICGEKFISLEVIEAHHLFQHAVTELLEGDSSRNIVEIICQTRSLRSEHMNCGQIERVVKVHNTQTTLARFEDYRESVMTKARKLCSKKHQRCQADGNELLRFYGTTVTCSLGSKTSQSLCGSGECGVCQILRHGFPSKVGANGMQGVFTCSTSKRALELVELDWGHQSLRKCLIVCRAIAGRVHKPLKDNQEIVGQSPFDSVAGRVGSHSKIDELYLPTPTALLPCFVVIFKALQKTQEAKTW